MGRDNGQETLNCASCGGSTVIEIELMLPDGTEVEFYSCHQCETRWWNRDGEALELGSVLEMAKRLPG
ncbi:MAG: hypothetical protein ACE5GC_08730 [Acidimicrobiia bacterium]